MSLWCREDFTAYADVCFKNFGDRVKYWSTVNEPNIEPIGGYDQGINPPRRCSYPFGLACEEGNSTTEPYIVAHHLLLAHASAASLYREKYQVWAIAISFYSRTAIILGWSIFADMIFCFVPLCSGWARRTNWANFAWLVVWACNGNSWWHSSSCKDEWLPYWMVRSSLNLNFHASNYLMSQHVNMCS